MICGAAEERTTNPIDHMDKSPTEDAIQHTEQDTHMRCKRKIRRPHKRRLVTYSEVGERFRRLHALKIEGTGQI